MDNKINILNELRDAGSTLLINTERKNYYSIPDGYFNGLAENIMARVFVESLPSVNPYTVPTGYFENFPEIILDKLGIAGTASFIHTGIEKMPYSVPEGYFNSLASNILQKIKSENSVQQELEEIAPLLSKIPKKNVYSVPDGYFDDLKPVLISKQTVTPAKVVSIGSRTRRWLNYAAAACVAAILFGGGYLYWNKQQVSNTGSNPIASVDVQSKVSGLSDAEIAAYLQEDNSAAVYTNQNSDDQQQNIDVKSLLENMSDEEIEEYLINNTDPAEVKKGI